MTIRLATTDDADFSRGLFQDFLTDTGKLDSSPPTKEKTESRIAMKNIVTVVDPEEGQLCEIKVDEGKHECEVSLLFPRGPDVEILRPILLRALEETAARFADASGWRLWAAFSGTDDGGFTACKAWEAIAPKTVVVGNTNGARIEGALGEVIDGLRR